MTSKRDTSLSAASVRGKPLTADDPRRGRGPAKGAPNAGRPPKRFGEFVRDIREETPGFRAAILRASENEESRAFPHVMKLVRDYDREAPEKRVAVSGGTSNVLRVEICYEPPTPPAPTDEVGSLEWRSTSPAAEPRSDG